MGTDLLIQCSLSARVVDSLTIKTALVLEGAVFSKKTAVIYPRSDLDAEAGRSALMASALLICACAIVGVVAVDLWGLPWALVPQSALAIGAAIAAILLQERRPKAGLFLLAGVSLFIAAYCSRALGYGGAVLLGVLAAGLAGLASRPTWGSVIVIAITVVLWWANDPTDLPDRLLAAMTSILCWAVPAFIWLYRRRVLDVVDWSWQEYQQMRASLDEALSQRVVLKETQEDLISANLQLERLSERLELMTRIAEDARAAKEEFLASVSHELRTPLNIIIGFSEMITESPGVYGARLPPSLLADIAAIQRNSQHLAGLVDDILDLSRADAGRMALTKEWVSLRDIVEAAVVAVRPLFDSKGLGLTIEIAPGLPLIHGDRTRLRQVLLNLLSNAGRHTMAGGVQVVASEAAGKVRCGVIDTGPGIAAEDLERVFEPFQQAGSAIRRRTEGSGLGLSISRRFIELHNGRMWLESELGKGTSVYFELPTLSPTLPNGADISRWFGPDTQVEVRTRPSRAPLPVTRPRFVVVESGEVMQRMLRREYYDAEIVPAASIKEAVQSLEASPANAMVLNSELAEHALHSESPLAALPQGTPGILCWAPSERELAERLGVLDYLVKPIERRRLLALLDELGDAVRRVLIVDDDREAIQLIVRLLQGGNRHYEILRATRAQRALTLMRHAAPDLVLLDLVMPGLDGYELLRIKRGDARLRSIPVIAITGQVAAASFADGRCVTVVRPSGVTLAALLGQVLSVTDALGRQSQAPADRAQPGTPDA